MPPTKMPPLRLLGSAFVAIVLAGCSSPSAPSSGLPADPDQLQPPPAGQGFQFKTGDVVVPAGTEEQDCYFFKVSDLAASGGLPSDQPVELHHIQIVQRAGSHHMNIFRVRTVKGLDPAQGAVVYGQNGQGPCFVSSNWSDWPLVANTQASGALDWTYPDGVSNELEPTEILMLQTHYVNATTQQTPSGAGKVAANFFVMPRQQVTAQLGTLFSTNQSIRVCQSNPTPTYTHACQFAAGATPLNIIGANGHFHSRGTRFDMFAWDGTSPTQPPASDLFYESTNWSDPPMAHGPQLDQVVPSNGGVWYTCSYQWQQPDPSIGGCDALNAADAAKGTAANQLDCCYTFGPLVDINEHCNAFVYYYPAQGNVNCF